MSEIRPVECENFLRAYQKELIVKESLLYKMGNKHRSRLGIQYSFDGKKYFIDRSRSYSISYELDSHVFFWKQTHPKESDVYRAVDIGGGLGFGGFYIGNRLHERWPNIKKELVITNVVQPPEFELPRSATNLELFAESGFIAELPSKYFVNAVDLTFSDSTIEWSKYPEIFLRGVYLMLRPGGVAFIITPKQFKNIKMDDLIIKSPFQRNFVPKLFSAFNEVVYCLYKPLGAGEELPNFSRRTQYNLNIWDTLPLVKY
jgi:SAM-dependent methyltransferase